MILFFLTSKVSNGKTATQYELAKNFDGGNGVTASNSRRDTSSGLGKAASFEEHGCTFSGGSNVDAPLPEPLS